MNTVTTKEQPLVLNFAGKAYAKMMSLVTSFTTEVAWYGVVRKENDYLYHVEDILVHPQYVNGGRVQDADEEYSKWLLQIWKQGDLFERMRLHGHSHVNFPASPSSLDMQNYQERTEQMDGSGLKIFMIWNKRNEFWISVLDYDVQAEPRQCNVYTVEGENLTVFTDKAKQKSSPLRYVPVRYSSVGTREAQAVQEFAETDDDIYDYSRSYEYDDPYVDTDLWEELRWSDYLDDQYYLSMEERYQDIPSDL